MVIPYQSRGYSVSKPWLFRIKAVVTPYQSHSYFVSIPWLLHIKAVVTWYQFLGYSVSMPYSISPQLRRVVRLIHIHIIISIRQPGRKIPAAGVYHYRPHKLLQACTIYGQLQIVKLYNKMLHCHVR